MDQTPPAGGFRWDDIDHTIVGPKLSKLAAEMHEKFVKDEERRLLVFAGQTLRDVIILMRDAGMRNRKELFSTENRGSGLEHADDLRSRQ